MGRESKQCTECANEALEVFLKIPFLGEKQCFFHCRCKACLRKTKITYFNTTRKHQIFFHLLVKTSDEFCKSNLESCKICTKYYIIILKVRLSKGIVFYEGTKGMCCDQNHWFWHLIWKKCQKKILLLETLYKTKFTGVYLLELLKKLYQKKNNIKKIAF